MLKKKHRLAKEKDVKLAFAKGRSFFNPYFVLKFRPTTADSPRFTVVVSTKVSKKAVARNRLKRLARESVRKKLVELRPGDYVLSVKPAAEKLEAKSFSSEVEVFFRKLKFIK